MNKTNETSGALLPNFVFHADKNPADMLSNAADVIEFLLDVAPAMTHNVQLSCGLSESGAMGLITIFRALGNTITTAQDAIQEERKAGKMVMTFSNGEAM